jgi:hypothetical protein
VAELLSGNVSSIHPVNAEAIKARAEARYIFFFFIPYL